MAQLESSVREFRLVPSEMENLAPDVIDFCDAGARGVLMEIS